MIGSTRSAKRRNRRVFFYMFALQSDRRPRALIVSAVLCCAAVLHVTIANGDSSSTSTRNDAVTRDLRTAGTAARTSKVRSSQFVQGEWPFRSLARPAVSTELPRGSQFENPIDVFVKRKLDAAH